MNRGFEQDIEQCLSILSRGGIILYPTDTIWGIGCDATNPAAVEKIYSLKQRPDHKALVVLVADEKDILSYVAAPDPLIFDYLESSTRPTTVVYEHALGVAENLSGDDGSLAIRICRDDFCRHLIRRFRRPLVSTSANISGQPSPKNFSMIGEEITGAVDYVVRYRQDDPGAGLPSRIIRWVKGRIEVIRD